MISFIFFRSSSRQSLFSAPSSASLSELASFFFFLADPFFFFLCFFSFFFFFFLGAESDSDELLLRLDEELSERDSFLFLPRDLDRDLECDLETLIGWVKETVDKMCRSLTC